MVGVVLELSLGQVDRPLEIAPFLTADPCEPVGRLVRFVLPCGGRFVVGGWLVVGLAVVVESLVAELGVAGEVGAGGGL